MPFLIDKLKAVGTPVDFVFVSRSPEYKKKKKDGTFMDVYDYTFKTRSDGKDHTEMIFAKTHDFVLSKAKLHDICRAEVNPENTAFVKWTVLPAGEDHAQPATNSAMVKSERGYSDGNQEQQVKGVQISLQGFMQVLIPMYISTQDMNPDDAVSSALETATKAYRALQERARRIALSDNT